MSKQLAKSVAHRHLAEATGRDLQPAVVDPIPILKCVGWHSPDPQSIQLVYRFPSGRVVFEPRRTMEHSTRAEVLLAGEAAFLRAMASQRDLDEACEDLALAMVNAS